MKKLVATVLCALITSGCSAAIKYKYDIGFELDAPDSHKDANLKNEMPYSYEDKVGNFFVFLNSKSLMLMLENKTSKNIQVLWNEATVTDFNGNVDRVLTEDMRVIDKFNTLNPTVIPKGGGITKLFWPANRVFSSEYGVLKSVWSEDEKTPDRITNKYITFMLPVSTEDKKLEYTFKFKINKVTVKVD